MDRGRSIRERYRPVGKMQLQQSDRGKKRRPLVRHVDGPALHPLASPVERSMELRRQLKPHISGAIGNLIKLMNSDDQMVALKATQEVITRFFGKPETATQEQVGASLVEALELIKQRAVAPGDTAVVIEAVPDMPDDTGT